MPTISESKKGKIKIAVNYSDHNPPRSQKSCLLIGILRGRARSPSGLSGRLIEGDAYDS